MSFNLVPYVNPKYSSILAKFSDSWIVTMIIPPSTGDIFTPSKY